MVLLIALVAVLLIALAALVIVNSGQSKRREKELPMQVAEKTVEEIFNRLQIRPQEIRPKHVDDR